MSFDPEQLTKYSSKTGVYLMKDHKGKVIYVGKANNLRSRLKQYFAKKGDERQTVLFLREEIFSIDTIIVPTEKDALLLENNLIKRHKPKYNILLKDDKTFIRLMITNHQWPMVKLTRGKTKPKEAKYLFGPYTNAKSARQTYDILLKLFPLRQCSDAELASRQRPCLLYDIKKCCAPCVGKCTQEQYEQYVQSARKLLLGKDKEVIKELTEKMEQASQRLAFEKANEYLTIIRHIEHVLSMQHVEHFDVGNCDVIGLYRQANVLIINALHYRGGKLVASKHYTQEQVVTESELLLGQFLIQHYHKENTPDSIYLPLDMPNITLIQEVLEERSQKKINIVVPKQGTKKRLVDIAMQNALSLFEREQNEQELYEKMLLDLQETLQLNHFPRRIECFDTSHIAGEDFVACVVAFVHGKKDKSRQKLFHIKSATKGSDYDAMKEALIRHFTKAKEKNDFCDLLILDGGKGHLNLAMQVFKDLGIANVDIISLAKEASSHAKTLTREKIYLPHDPLPLQVDRHSPLLFLLQKIRDETHRVAIGFHRKTRSKRTLKSELDNLKGIGPKKKKALLVHFKSVANIKKAPIDELTKIKELTRKDIETLLAFQKKD
jgi:excinuclease ABC subunit C